MNNEQPKVLGAGTSLNKEYWKSNTASNSSCKFLERDLCLRRATNSCNRSRASQTDGYNGSMVCSIHCTVSSDRDALPERFSL